MRGRMDFRTLTNNLEHQLHLDDQQDGVDSFEGTDAMSGDQLALVNERLVVGYDVDTGSLYGYTPAD